MSSCWDLPYRGIESWSLALAGRFFIPRTTLEARGSQYSILSVIYVKITNRLALPPWADSPWPPPWGASGFPARMLGVQYRSAGGGGMGWERGVQGHSPRPARMGLGCLSSFPYSWRSKFHFYPEAGALLASTRYDYFAKPRGLQRAAIKQEIPVEIIGRWWWRPGSSILCRSFIRTVSSSNVCSLLRALHFRRTKSSFGWKHDLDPPEVSTLLLVSPAAQRHLLRA